MILKDILNYFQKYSLIFFFLLHCFLICYLINVITSIFQEEKNDDKELILNMNDTPYEVTKRYFKINPYVKLQRKNKQIICKDGERKKKICNNMKYINEKIDEIIKVLNRDEEEVEEEESSPNNNNNSNTSDNSKNSNNSNSRQKKKKGKEVIIKTEKEFIHHVIVEILLVLLQLIDYQLDAGTKLCQKNETNDGYISICKLIPIDPSKEE